VYTVRQPDIAIFLGEHVRQIDLDKIPVPFAPDIAVEVLPPSEKAIDVRRKVLDYLRGGSQEVWLLDHANAEILVHTNDGIRVLQEKDVLESSARARVLASTVWPMEERTMIGRAVLRASSVARLVLTPAGRMLS